MLNVGGTERESSGFPSSQHGAASGPRNEKPSSMTIHQTPEADGKALDSAYAGKEKEMTPFREMLRFCTRGEVALLALGLLGSALAGAMFPLFAFVLGNLLEDFITGSRDASHYGEKYAARFYLVASVMFFACSLQKVCLTLVGRRIVKRIRVLYLKGRLQQEMAFWDAPGTDIAEKMHTQTERIKTAFADDLGEGIRCVSTFVSGYAIGFTISWELTLIAVAAIPFLAAGGFMLSQVIPSSEIGKAKVYAPIKVLADEVVVMFRPILAFGLEQRLTKRFGDALKTSETNAIEKARADSLGRGYAQAILYISFTFAFLAGGALVNRDREAAALAFPPEEGIASQCNVKVRLTPQEGMNLECGSAFIEKSLVLQTLGDVCTCVRCFCGCIMSETCLTGFDVVMTMLTLILGGISIGQARPRLTAISEARLTATAIFETIPWNLNSSKLSQSAGLHLDEVHGRISFEDVAFAYLNRRRLYRVEGLNLSIEPYTSVVCVDGSSSKRSPLCSLLLRFYDPDSGIVRVDGHDVRSLSTEWLRNQIGLVCQEPVLFKTSIRANIAYGACSASGQLPTSAQIEAAARAANILEFIEGLPNGFDTVVKSSMDEEQRQCVAIARAVLRNPKILLLDHVVDSINDSNKMVHNVLEKLMTSRKRTMVLFTDQPVAFRHADRIVVLKRDRELRLGVNTERLRKCGHNRLTHRVRKPRQHDRSALQAKVLPKEEEPSQSTPNEAPSSALSNNQGEINVSDVEACVASEKKHETCEMPGSVKEAIKEEETPEQSVCGFAHGENWLYFPAVAMALIKGASLPVLAVVFSGVTSVFTQPTRELVRNSAFLHALHCVLLGVVVSFSNYWASYLFRLIEIKATMRERSSRFQALFHRDTLVSRATGEYQLSSQLDPGEYVPETEFPRKVDVVVTTVSLLLVGLSFAIYTGWELALVLIAVVLPLSAKGVGSQVLLMCPGTRPESQDAQNNSRLLSKIVESIRTIVAFNLEASVLEVYEATLAQQDALLFGPTVLTGISFGLSQVMILIVHGAAIYVGSFFMDENPDYTLEKVFHIFYVVFMTGTGLGQTFVWAPFAKGSQVSQKLTPQRKYVTRDVPHSRQDSLKSSEGTLVHPSPPEGSEVVFESVSLTDSKRPSEVKLDHVDIFVNRGSVVAILSESEESASAVLQLLENISEASSGVVRVDGNDVSGTTIASLRKRMGLVVQGPSLFHATIFENIACGISEEDIRNNNLVLRECVVEAAKSAGAHDFIMALPQQYRTFASSSGFSKSQEERVALARSLIRKPSLLLLDGTAVMFENLSQKQVHNSVTRFSSTCGQKTVLVANCLPMAQVANVVIFLSKGKIVEQGTHNDLIANGGAYAKYFRSRQVGGA